MTSIALADYNIQIGSVWPVLQEILVEKQYSRIAIIVDENTRKHCLPVLQAAMALNNPLVLEIKAGEKNKNIETCSQVWSALMEADFDRRALVLNLGGGVIGDMGGFCASTFKRGIDFIQIPTTLLSQVDASIGGKLGIDFAEIKNSVGLFCNPQAVLIEPTFLNTLTARELRSGFAEIIKHSLIADVEQWQRQLSYDNLSDLDWLTVIPDSLRIKQRIVAEDPFERGLRKALNFGHTIGHAVESEALQGESPLLHGEAIAIGMVCEAFLSHRLTGLKADDLEQIKTAILRWYGHEPQRPERFEHLIRLMRNDKKNEGDGINFTLLSAPGTALINQIAAEDLIIESLNYYNA